MAAWEQFTPHSHIPYGKDGSGFFSDNADGHYAVAAEAIPLVLAAVHSVKPGPVFTIVDYGCADGGTSMPVMYACVKAVREKYGNELPIQVIYEDQPVNDFKSLFLRLQGLIPGTPSFYLDFPNVFVTACGTDFYNQCFPNSSVTLGYSSTAMHWLRDKPCDMTGTLFAQLIAVKEEKEAFSKQAEKDWETILLKRSSELMPGGRMIVVQVGAIDEGGQFSGSIKQKRVSMERVMTDLWQGLADDDTITQEEFLKTNLILYYRTVQECEKPFRCEDSAVRKKGLRLVSIGTKIVPCPYHQKWLTEKGDPKAHAREYVASLRIWSNSTFIAGLSDSRASEEKTRIVDEMFKRYEAEVAKCPEDHGLDFVHMHMVVEKQQ